MKRLLFSCFFISSCSHYVEGYDGYTKEQLKAIDSSIFTYYKTYPKKDGSILGYHYSDCLSEFKAEQEGFKKVLFDSNGYSVYEKNIISDGISKELNVVTKNNKPRAMFAVFKSLNNNDIPNHFIESLNKTIRDNYGVDPVISTRITLMKKSSYENEFISRKPSKDGYLNYKKGISNTIESIDYSYYKPKDNTGKYNFKEVVYRIGFVGDELQKQIEESAIQKSTMDFIER